MPSQSASYTESSTVPTQNSPRRDRAQAAADLQAVDESLRRGASQRQAAKDAGVPRSTWRHWNSRRSSLALPPQVAAVLETPAGLAWLHQVVHAGVFAMTLRGPQGIRMVCEFLELSGLAEVVGASFGSIQKLTSRMQEELVDIASEYREELASTMPSKPITVCEDETFHPDTCLVAIEPVSNFILLERYVERRDAETWNAEMDQALHGLPVQVVQSSSDQGAALLRHAKDRGAHHSPDVFHPQHDLIQATALALAHRVRRAAEHFNKAVHQKEAWLAQRDAAYSKPRGPGRPIDFASRIKRADEAIESAQQAVEQALADQEVCGEAIRGISANYHCYRLADGAVQCAEQVRALLDERFAVIDEVATRAKLSDKCLKKIDKARRVTEEMVATIGFIHTETAVRLAGLDICTELRAELANKWIPGLYLRRVAGQAKLSEDRRAIAAAAEALLGPLRDPTHPLQQLDAELAAEVDGVATLAANLFQRSSSCVEGRNGQLALFHHGLHRLTDKKLAALTAVHNFHTRRPDGTTPADRFFETPHPDIFTTLLSRMPQLARPARPRSKRPYRAGRGARS